MELLCGEGPEVSEKLPAALVKCAPTARRRRCLQVPRLRHTFRSRLQNSTTTSRLTMPEEHMRVIMGAGWAASRPGEALFLVTMYDTCLRPIAGHCLMDVDIAGPQQEVGPHVVRESPFEREKAAKAGRYDECLILAGDLLPCLERLLKELAELRQSESDAHKDDPVGVSRSRCALSSATSKAPSS